MISNKPYSDRRILTFPAIRPCPSISPSTLLSSLSDLATGISCFRSGRLTIFCCCIREFLREAGILSAFFDNLRACRAHVPESAVAGLLDIHVALQKLRWLLSDCARTGARLWMLMNCCRVLSELRLVARSISIALDSVEESTLDFDEDMKEMIGLLAKQSRGLVIRIDSEDDRTVRAVSSILKKFRSGVSPDPTDLRWVLDRLDVRNWEDCHEEVAFLEEQILEYSTGEEEDDDAALLNSLMRLMIYCRVVLFEADEANPKGDRRCKCEPRRFEMLGLNPESFRCPISLELMTDPVTISTGQTYDRESIVRWFKDGHRICPVTGETLKDVKIVPNSALQKLISTQASTGDNHKRRGLTKTMFPPSTSAVKATRMTVAFLVDKLSKGSDKEKNRAAYEIRLLTKSNLFHRVCLVEADSVPWLLRLFSSPDPRTQDNAVAALLSLSKVPVGKTAISDIGGVKFVVDAITQGLKVEVRQNAATVLFYLSSVDEYRQEIGEIPEAIPALVNLLKKGAYRARKSAAAALFGLLSFPGNHNKALSTGVVSVLNDMLADEREDLVNDCVGILAKIAERKEGTNVILESSSNLLARLVQILQSDSARSGKEHSISLMLSLFKNSGGRKIISQSETLPLLMPSLYSMIAGGPPQASKNARMLINHIHVIYDQDYPISASPRPTVEDDRVIYAL